MLDNQRFPSARSWWTDNAEGPPAERGEKIPKTPCKDEWVVVIAGVNPSALALFALEHCTVGSMLPTFWFTVVPATQRQRITVLYWKMDFSHHCSFPGATRF